MTIRLSAILIAATLVMPSAPEAQDRSKTDARDFRMFLHTIALRQNARVCEGSSAEYGRTFNDLYAKWSERHRAEIARGETIFNEAVRAKDLKNYPFTNRTALARAEAALVELKDPPPTAPSASTPTQAVACEKTLIFLKTE